jgi:ABC-2 type transport system permease protein
MASVSGSVPPVLATPLTGMQPLRPRGWREELKSFITAVRLGWQIEANWTDPLLFFIYSVAKPIASALILVFMLEVISGSGADPRFKAFVVVGTALWSFVINGMAGLATSVLDDRERYRMLKYLYVSPAPFVLLLLGRGVARIAVGAMGAIITIAAGVLFLGVPFDIARVDWLMLVIVMPLGLASVIAVGILLAGVTMQLRQEAWSYPQAVAGAMFLLVGAIFPLAVLPLAAQGAGLLLPLTWWLAGAREALFPDSISSVGGEGSLFVALTGRAEPTSVEIVVALLATGAVVTLAAMAVFRASERRAKDRGLLDNLTGS